jgi:ankyrin repeat protein
MVKLRGFGVTSGGGGGGGDHKPSSSTMVARIRAEQSGYDTVPSPLQLASFGTELVKAVHESDVVKLGRLLATGLSPNPCNQFRDSIVDLVCKRANADIFQCLVDHGCDLRVCDGFGRTPLHHCCWASEFNAEIATLILRTDPQQLFMEDKRGQTPLEYVRSDQASEWMEYLETNANLLFPTGGSLPPVLSLKLTRPTGHIPDPPNALPVQLAAAVSSGNVTPDDLQGMDPALRARFL